MKKTKKMVYGVKRVDTICKSSSLAHGGPVEFQSLLEEEYAIVKE